MKKNTAILASVLALGGILLCVIALMFSLMNAITNPSNVNEIYTLAFLAIALLILFVASITSKRIKMSKVIGLIISILVVVVTLSMTISRYTSIISSQGKHPQLFVYFVFSLLSLIASIFELIYYISSFRTKMSKLYVISNLTTTGLVVINAICYLIFSIVLYATNNGLVFVDNILLFFTFGLTTFLPYLVLKDIEA